MVECSLVTAFAAIGAAFIGFKVLTLLKTLFDSYVASGISVSFYTRHLENIFIPMSFY